MTIEKITTKSWESWEKIANQVRQMEYTHPPVSGESSKCPNPEAYVWGFEEGAKYVLSQQAKDVDELRKEFGLQFSKGEDTHDLLMALIWKWIEPHLNTQKEEWVSVDIKPTGRIFTCLCFNGDAPEYNQHVFIATWFSQTQTFRFDYKILGSVTHWMPIPNIPNPPAKQ